MKDNDLSAAPTYRYWVMADVVFVQREVSEKSRSLFRLKERTVTTYVPDLAALSLLWNWTVQRGVRLEVVFLHDAVDMWKALDSFAANPFNDYVVFGSVNDLTRTMAYRPDVLGVIDVPAGVLRFGRRGLTITELR